MGPIAASAAVAILSAGFVGYLFGREHRCRGMRRQVAAALDAVSRIAWDVRTMPHTKDQLEREAMPLLTERQR